MIKHKCIQLNPTDWYLDVICCPNNKESELFFNDRYDIKDFDELYVDGNFVTKIDCGENSKLGKDYQIVVLKLHEFKKSVIVHELIHVLNYVGKYTGLEISFKSQEWQACFVEKLFIEICKPNYNDIKKYERKGK